MIVCNKCKKSVAVYTGLKGNQVCMDCHKKIQTEALLERSQSVEKAEHLRDWSERDQSELFWITFVEYKKKPTLKGIELINRIFLWACHANHCLSNTIHNVFDWCGMDLWTELESQRAKAKSQTE